MYRSVLIFVNIVVTLYLVQSAYSARILASVSTASYSHQVAFRPIWKELAKRGHEIVLMTTDPMEKTDNVRQINLNASYEILKQRNYSSIVTNEETNFNTILLDIFLDYIFEQIKHPEVQQLMNNKSEKFDLLMIEMLFPIHLGLIEKIKAPVIALTSFEATRTLHSYMGNGAHPVLYPEINLISESYPLPLGKRILSTVGLLLTEAFYESYYLQILNKQMREAFGENCRSFEELRKEIDMLFINTNPILHDIRPLVPNTILFGGGTHVKLDNKPLPEDLRNFLDNATNGIIYFSLGTNIKGNLLNDNLQRIFVDTFAELPHKILWKFENENITLKSDNVMIKKWVPQGAVLGHSNIKLFITQCGLQSIEEAIMNHIPMVGIPFIGDQSANGYRLQKKGLAVILKYSTLTKQIFKEAIIEVITNTKYKETVIETADLFTDVEMSGLEKVVWWTEYVIRNRGAKHLKFPVMDIPFYQRYLLDVISVVLGIIFISFFCIKKIFLILKTLFSVIKNKNE